MEARGDLRELHELAGVGVAADFVLQAARQTHRAFAHPLLDERRHLLNLGVGSRTLVVVAHRQPADSRMADHDGDVHGRGALPPRREVLSDRPRRAAVRTEHHRGNPLCDLGRRRRLRRELGGGVIVDVDESWSDDQSFGVDDAVARERLHIRTHADDAIVHDADVGAPQRSAGAIGHVAADNRRCASADLRARRGSAQHQQQKARQAAHQNPLGRMEKCSCQVPPAGICCRSL